MYVCMYVCMYICMLACVSDFNFSAVRLDINSKADNIFCLLSGVSCGLKMQGISNTATFCIFFYLISVVMIHVCRKANLK